LKSTVKGRTVYKGMTLEGMRRYEWRTLYKGKVNDKRWYQCDDEDCWRNIKYIFTGRDYGAVKRSSPRKLYLV